MTRAKHEKPERENAAPKIKARVMVRKFRGDDTSGEPYETVVLEDEGFADLLKEIEKNATD